MCIGETHTLGSSTIYIRSVDRFCTITTEITETNIIGINKNDIGTLRFVILRNNLLSQTRS